MKKILNKLNGLHYHQEYLCLAKELHAQPLHAYAVKDNRITKDITNGHLFIGYNPVIFAFSPLDEFAFSSSLQLIFSHRVLLPNDLCTGKDALASIILKQIKRQVAGNPVVYYFEGIHGTHQFISVFHQFINGMSNHLFNKKPGNVYLHNNLYKQVQIAYAIPRNISLITVSNKNLFNLFPTDLHGQIDDHHYIISLRINGKACEQVEACGRLVISKVHCDAYKMVYAMGKNHMQELKSEDNFPFNTLSSEKFQFPLPQHVQSYRELILKESFIHGIHKIMLFKIVFHHQIEAGNSSLAHIHNSYATWRYKRKFPGNYLLR